MSDGKAELHKAHREGQEKYTYFLLAAAGACIAFAITQTQAATITPEKLPLALAVASWGLSFVCGFYQIWQSTNLLQQNYQLLRAEKGQHPDFPPDPAFLKSIERSIEDQANKSGNYGRWQFRLLIAGAVFFIVWHILEMYARTVAH